MAVQFNTTSCPRLTRSPVASRRFSPRQYRGPEADYGYSFPAHFKIIATSTIHRIQNVQDLHCPAYARRPVAIFSLKWDDKSPCKYNRTEDDGAQSFLKKLMGPQRSAFCGKP